MVEEKIFTPSPQILLQVVLPSMVETQRPYEVSIVYLGFGFLQAHSYPPLCLAVCVCTCVHVSVCACACARARLPLTAPSLLLSRAGPRPQGGPALREVTSPGWSAEVSTPPAFFWRDYDFDHRYTITVAVTLSYSACLPFLALFFCLSLHFCLYFILFCSADRDKSTS